MRLSKQHRIEILIIIAFGSLLLLYYNIRRPITNYPSSGTEIIAFGDSLVQGIGSTGANNFVAILSKKIRQPVVNLGHKGDTTMEALNRLKEFDGHDLKVVLLLFGGNDYLRSLPIQETEKNLAKVIQNIQSRGAVVVLLGVRGGVFNDNFKEMYERLRDEYHTAYVSDVLSGLFANPNYMSDFVHPNNDGYKVIAERVYPVLEKFVK